MSFQVLFLNEADKFIDSLESKARTKILYNIKKTQLINSKLLFKKLNDNIWEFRTNYSGISYRLFAFWDKSNKQETLVISTHGIIKKSQKTPKKEIAKAEQIRIEYLKLNS